jgi:ribosomal-protein-alanine N-acetyltransferase
MKKNEKAVRVPRMETERLVLRQLTARDLRFIYQLFSLEETNRYVLDPPVKNLKEAREIYELYCKPKPHLFRLGIVVKATGELVGTLGLYAINREDRRATLGFDLLPAHWGKGYMTEACCAMLDWAFKELKLNRIQASAEPANVRSLAVMERLGFTREGVLRQLEYYKGAYHDDVMYSMLRDEWANGKRFIPKAARRGREGPGKMKGKHRANLMRHQ